MTVDEAECFVTAPNQTRTSHLNCAKIPAGGRAEWGVLHGMGHLHPDITTGPVGVLTP